MPAGRATRDTQEIGVRAVLVGMLAVPRDRLLEVDEMIRERGHGG